MSRIPFWVKVVTAATASLMLFIYLSLMLVPSLELQRLAVRIIAPYGLTLTSTSFGKTLPIGIRAKGFTLATQTGAVLKFDRLTVKLRLLPLLIGRVILACDAGVGPGTVEGELEITRKGRIEFSCQKVRLEDIPFFSTVAGAWAKGELRIKGDLHGRGSASKGYLQIEAKQLDLREVRISGTQLPDASYKTMQGMLRIANGRTTLESVTLQGEGLYVRLSGDLPAGGNPAAMPLNLKLELMPKAEFLESQKFIFILLAKYMVTPGHYQLPIRGTLASPVLQ